MSKNDGGGNKMKLEVMNLVHKFWNKKYEDLYNEKFIYDDGYEKYSEHSEDRIVELIFRKYKPLNRWCVDVGCDSETSSNTYLMVKNDWNSIQIESNPILFTEWRTRMLDYPKVKMCSDFITPGKIGPLVEINCLDSVLSRYGVPKYFDFLSIDVDNYEYEIWKNLRNYKPNVVCIECNQYELDFSIIDYDPSFSLNKYRGKDKSYGGATVGLMNKLAQSKGYDYLCFDVSNAFYLRKGFVK